MAHVFDVMLHHNQPLHAATPGKPGVDFGVYVGHPEHVGVNHAAAEQLNPAAVATDLTAFFLAEWTAQRKFKTWFGKREVEWLRFDFKLLLIVFLQKCFERCHEVARVDALVYIHTFKLVKGVLVARVQILVTKHADGDEDGDG